MGLVTFGYMLAGKHVPTAPASSLPKEDANRPPKEMRTDDVTRDVYNRNREMMTRITRAPPSSTPAKEKTTEYVEPPSTKIRSKLSGALIDEGKFIGNDVLPFFGGSVKQNTKGGNHVVERYTGDQVIADIVGPKRERAPLFAPSKNMSDMDGAPGRKAYLAEYDRMSAPVATNNTTPFDRVMVGPGVTGGYDSAPSGGFNQDVRDQVRLKTVDDLRVATNPKTSYGARSVAGTKGSVPGEIGDMFKRRTDTYYENTPDRYLTTMGAHTKEASRPVHEIKETKSALPQEYTGTSYGGDRNQYNPRIETYEEPRGKQLQAVENTNAYLGHMRPQTRDDYGKAGIKIYDNERNITEVKTTPGSVQSLVKSIIAPITDVMRVSKKESMVGNPRQYGSMHAQVPEKQTVYDSHDVARTTIKETLIHDTRTGNVELPKSGAVYDPDEVARITVRQTLPNQYNANLYGTSKPPAWNPDDDVRTTIRETTEESERDGNVGGVAVDGGYITNDYKVDPTQKQGTSCHDHIGGAGVNNENGYLQAPVNIRNTYKQILSDNEYYGQSKSSRTKEMSHEAARGARTNSEKELLSSQRVPTWAGVKVGSGTDQVNLDPMTNRCMLESSTHAGNVRPVEKRGGDIGLETTRDKIAPGDTSNRLDTGILDTYKSNPYTQSLHSVA